MSLEDLLPKEGCKIKIYCYGIDHGIFTELEIRHNCEEPEIGEDDEDDDGDCDCSNKFCSFLKNMCCYRRWTCWNCFKSYFIHSDYSDDIQYRKTYKKLKNILKKRYDTVFGILIKFVCNDVTREILEFSERIL
jgi:hypothetical protein